MKVEIWSDVVCPWCYIGKRRFETALSQFPHRDQVEVIWRSYQLDPSAPDTSDLSVNELLAQKYGMSVQQAAATTDHITELAAEEGLDYHLEKAKRGNTFDAHRLIHLAAKHGLQDKAKERLLRAYFIEGEPIGDHDTLVRLLAEVGINSDVARTVLNSNAYADEVSADERRARLFGIGGVPFFAIDEKYGVSGAQPAEVFTELLETAWSDKHPLVAVGASSEGGTCEGDSCVI